MSAFTRALWAFGPIDLRQLLREPLNRQMLLGALIAPAAVGILMPVILPPIGDLVGVPLRPLTPEIVGYTIVVLLPVLFGVLIGFLLLDSRDEGTLAVLRVAPVPLWQVLIVRLVAPTLLSIVVTALVLAAFEPPLRPLGWGGRLLTALLAAGLAPWFALVLVTLARNKVAGMAVMKALGNVLLLPPVVALIWPGWAEALVMVFPSYWPVKLYWQLIHGAANWPLFATGGALVIAVNCVLLFRWYQHQLTSD